MQARRRSGGFRRLQLLLVLLSLLVVAVACGGDSASDTTASAEVPATGIVATAGGGEFDLAELGEGPALVWFWAPW